MERFLRAGAGTERESASEGSRNRFRDFESIGSNRYSGIVSKRDERKALVVQPLLWLEMEKKFKSNTVIVANFLGLCWRQAWRPGGAWEEKVFPAHGSC